jgi:hypothetical protein
VIIPDRERNKGKETWRTLYKNVCVLKRDFGKFMAVIFLKPNLVMSKASIFGSID